MKFLVVFAILAVSLPAVVRGNPDQNLNATGSDEFQIETDEVANETSSSIESTSSVEVTIPEVPSDFKRTVILIHKETAYGEMLFIRGGIDHNQREGCGDREDLDQDPCSIPIKSRVLDIKGAVDARDDWAFGDHHLDWYGPEEGQGKYNGVAAEGTPAQWTTNDKDNDYYSSLNSFGPNYWLVDIDMDCSKTEDNFFELKAVLHNQFEPTYSQLDVRCAGDEARDLPYQANNHFGLCGFINVFKYGVGDCEIVEFN